MAKRLTLNVKKATVLLRDGHPDVLSLDLDAVHSPFPKMGYEASLTMQVSPGHGEEYCKIEFDIDPEVIDARHTKEKFGK